MARASVRGWEYAFAHPEAALDVVMSHVSAAHLPTNRMHQKWMLESLRQAMTGPGDPLGTLTRPRYQAAAMSLTFTRIRIPPPDINHDVQPGGFLLPLPTAPAAQVGPVAPEGRPTHFPEHTCYPG